MSYPATKNYQLSRGCADDLRAALTIVADFTERAKSSGKFTSFFNELFSAGYSKKEFKAVLQAVDRLKSNSSIIQILQSGDVGQRKLAALAVATIQNYNKTIAEENWGRKFAQLIRRTIGLIPLEEIELPDFAISVMQDEAASRKVSETFFAVREQITTQPPPKALQSNKDRAAQEYELFRLKGIVIGEKRGLPREFIAQALNEAPLTTATASDQQTASTRVTYEQQFEVFPGEMNKAVGIFERNPKALSRVMPVSFDLTPTYTFTGYPEPSQRHGWSLAMELIPACPHRLGRLPQFQQLHQKKKALRQELTETENLRTAKRWFSLKKDAFRENKKVFLSLHRELNAELQGHRDQALSKQFFDGLEDIDGAFEQLIKAHNLVNKYYIITPYQILREARWKQTHPGLQHEDAACRFEAATRILEQEQIRATEELTLKVESASNDWERCHYEYVGALGRAIAESARKMILQQKSEVLEFYAPSLTNEEQKLQALLYAHLINFIEEINTKLPEDDAAALEKVEQTMRNSLVNDIQFLKGQATHNDQQVGMQVVSELERYYSQRFKEL